MVNSKNYKVIKQNKQDHEKNVGINIVSVSMFHEFRQMLESGMKEADYYNFGLAMLIWNEASSIVSHFRMRRMSHYFFDAGVAAKAYYKKNLKKWEKDAYMLKHYPEWKIGRAHV